MTGPLVCPNPRCDGSGNLRPGCAETFKNPRPCPVCGPGGYADQVRDQEKQRYLGLILALAEDRASQTITTGEFWDRWGRPSKSDVGLLVDAIREEADND